MRMVPSRCSVDGIHARDLPLKTSSALPLHNGDPMVYAEYDDGIGTLIGGYPSSLVDRGGDIDPSVMEGDFLDRVVLDASAELCLSASLDETEEEMTVTLMVTPTSDFDDSWRVGSCLKRKRGHRNW